MATLVKYLFIIGSFAFAVVVPITTNRHWIFRLMDVWVIAGFSFRLGQRYPRAWIRTPRQPPTAPLHLNGESAISSN
jgi:hypothetical protein